MARRSKIEELAPYVVVGLILLWVFIFKPIWEWVRVHPVLASAIMVFSLAVIGYAAHFFLKRRGDARAQWELERKRELAVLRRDELQGLAETDREILLSKWLRELEEKGERPAKKKRVPVPRKAKSFVLERANHKCQKCGVDIGLQLHHIDRNPSNNVPSNLIVLCPTHHAEADKGVIRRETLKAIQQKQAATKVKHI